MASQDDETEGTDSSSGGRPGRPIEISRILRSVRRGVWLLIAAAVIGVVIGVSVAKWGIHHSYEASSTVRYAGVPNFVDGTRGQPERDMGPLVQTLHSDAVMHEMRIREEIDGPLDAVRGLFTQTVDGPAGLITLTSRARDPEEAAAFVNNLVEIFLHQAQVVRLEVIDGELAGLDERIRAAETELSGARSRYDGFRREHGVADLTTEQEAAIESAADLRAQADLTVAEISALQARVEQLQQDVRRIPRTQVVSSSTTSPDQAELVEAQQQLDALRSRLGEDHPQRQAMEARVRQLQARIASGGGSRIGSATMGASTLYESAQADLSTAQADLQAARERRTQLDNLATQAQQRVAMFSSIEGEAAQLMADLHVKETLLGELRSQRARIESMREHPDTGLTVIARATPPESAVRSRTKYIVAAGVPAALVVLALAFLLLRDLRGLRLFTPAEIAFWSKSPVVGATVWPRDTRAMTDLVSSLDDVVPESKGTMLVVGATDKETALAVEIAKQLSSDWSDSTLIEPGSMAGPDPLGRRSLPASGSPSSSGVLTSAEFDVAPTEVHRGGQIELLGPPTIVQGGAPYGVLNAHARQAEDGGPRLTVTAWEGNGSPQQLRRAARLADRVLVVVPSGAIGARQLMTLPTRLGREEGMGMLVVGLPDEYADHPDRVGDIDGFWAATRNHDEAA